MLQQLALLFVSTIGGLLIGAGVLHVVPRLGAAGRRLADAFCRPPAIDVILFYFTAVPWIVAYVVLGWAGVGVSVVAQVITLYVWAFLHELAHPGVRGGPRIAPTLNRLVGLPANHLAVWWTAWAVPVFWLVRFAQILVYPPITWLVRLPKYKAVDWMTISRQKFSGLVGWDLVWCVYCDWMTGLWSLGTEMLRNVESFWCPIRFYDKKKCDNCVIDFPDIDGGWVPNDGTMDDVTKVLEEKYSGKVNAWFGHPVRVTVEGAPVEDDQAGA